MNVPPPKPATKAFSMFAGVVERPRRPTLTLPAKPAPPPAVTKATGPKPTTAKPGAPKASTPKAAPKPPAPLAKPKPPAPATAAPKPPAPPPAPAAPPPEEDPLISARIAALAAARQALPEIFSDTFPALPHDVFGQLRGIGLDEAVAQAVVEWWCEHPKYRRARRPPPPSAKTLELVQDLAPDLFDPNDPKPLAVGIHHQLIAQGLAPAEVSTLLRYWTRLPKYVAALRRPDSRRFNLDGSDAGPVAEEHRAHAQGPRREADKNTRPPVLETGAAVREPCGTASACSPPPAAH